MGIKLQKAIALALGLSAAIALAACNGTDQTEETSASLWTFPEVSADVNTEDQGNILVNGDFSDPDTSMWALAQGSSVVSSADDEDIKLTGYGNYGVIDREASSSSPYDCFAQDITDVIASGVTYDFEFYARLSDDYEGAPADQRVIDFAPYLTVNGSTTYLGSYSSEITGASSQTLEPGEWVRFAGTFTPMWNGTLDQAVIRIIEQGTDYGNGDCVKGDYYIAGVKLIPQELPDDYVAPEVQTDIPELRSVIASPEGLGEDAICGTSIVSSELNDALLMELVTRHFNAVTLGNELKPDAMFGYNNTAYAEGSLHEEDFNGQTITVPTLDHSRADQILDTILEWNESNPDSPIRVRGHVLVWHSQTPEWFFHEDYDASKDYVSPEEMNVRLEWYIRSMLEYYTGDESPYKDLFYGWDVVNEAVSDTTNTYRTDEESGNDLLTDSTHGSKSSWWKVYGSNEFIINAFRFANMYAPDTLELYYNDYNECNPGKCQGIIALIEDVKAAEGTRIDGFGMQGHYGVNAPSLTQIEDAVNAYVSVVDKVMLTEFDVKNSGLFDGSEAALPEELNRQGVYYNEIYELLKEIDSRDDADISGITVWGVIDPNSWLQSAGNVGGASDGSAVQYPLLFDGNYQAKPSYWAFVDPSVLDFNTHIERPSMNISRGTVTVDGEIDEAWDNAGEIPLDIVLGAQSGGTARLLWDDENLYVLFEVNDDVLNNDSEDPWQQDSVEVFIDENHSRSGAYEPDDKQYRISYINDLSFNGEQCNEDNMNSETVITDNGYIVEASFRWTDITPVADETEIGLELQINDGGADGVRLGTASWADNTGTGYINPEVFGTGVLTE